jgi:hypothetical protein
MDKKKSHTGEKERVDIFGEVGVTSLSFNGFLDLYFSKE